MNLVDSSGWLEYCADAENAAFFESVIEDVDHLLVPSINLYEVFKRICQLRGEGVALQAIAQMQQGQVAELTSAPALSAERHGSSMSDQAPQGPEDLVSHQVALRLDNHGCRL